MTTYTLQVFGDGLPEAIETAVAIEISPGVYLARIDDIPQGNYGVYYRQGDLAVGYDELIISESVGSYLGEPIYPVAVKVVDVPTDLPALIAAALAGTKTIHLSAPNLVGNKLSQPIVQGDSYLFNADLSKSRSIDFRRTDFPSLEGATAHLYLTKYHDCNETVFDCPCTIVDDSTVRLEIPSSVSSEMPLGRYCFNVTVTFPDGNSACFVGPNSSLEVIPRGQTT